MAKLIDKEPQYEGERKVWNAFYSNLPQDWVVYNTRSVNGREFDFCVMAPEVGLFIIEVKGWPPTSVLTVVNENTIFLEGREHSEKSPRGQARGYRFDLLNKIRRELGMNPLIMSLVCYPFISKEQYFDKGLNIVSEQNETIFDEELQDPTLLYRKFIDRYNVDKGVKHDTLSPKKFALLRHYFEPNYDLKQDEEILNPGYSRLRIFTKDLDASQIQGIVDEYFLGIKEIVFVPSKSSLTSLVGTLNLKLQERKIFPFKGNLSIGESNIAIRTDEMHFDIFNFEIEVVHDASNLVDKDILVEEGECTPEVRDILENLSKTSAFNFQQYEIEHAPCDRNILVTAGAGTGKTYSMVSRVAFLCNKTADSIVDIAGDIAMITFTNDAADNMKNRLKKMFMNYFILTSNEKYMHLIEDISRIHISTIHKFAISLLQRNCIQLGIGYDCQVSNETYNRNKLYHKYLNQYLVEKNEENPNFAQQLPLSTYRLEQLLTEFCDKLYDQSVDVKKLSSASFGEPISILPFFNELVDEVMIKAENDYATELKDANLLGLRECMIQINDLVNKQRIAKQGNEFKYVFVDEFQDTDDVQIETITNLQHLFGDQCKLFIVGDLKQSIYRFRGATLSAFEKAVAVDGAKAWIFYSLNRNYRTDHRLLDRFHNVFQQMGRRDYLPYDESKDRLTSLITNSLTEDQLIRRIDTHLKDDNLFYQTFFDELEKQTIELNKINEHEKLSAEEKTIAILVRYNWQAQQIVSRAKNRGVTIKTTEGGDLYRLPSTRDLYKLVMAVTHPMNELYLVSLLTSNYVSMPINLIGISGKSPDEKRRELIRLLDHYFLLCMNMTWNQLINEFESRPVLVVLRDIYDSVKPWTRFKDEDAQISYRQNYDCLLEEITSRYRWNYLTINKVLDFLKINITTYQEAATRMASNASDDIQVICTTIHKSKGLEYGTVILPFTNEDMSNINIGKMNVNYLDGKVGYRLTIKDVGTEHNEYFEEAMEMDEKLQEESRVLYVALTRAIHNVVWFNDLDSSSDDNWARFLEDAE